MRCESPHAVKANIAIIIKNIFMANEYHEKSHIKTSPNVAFKCVYFITIPIGGHGEAYFSPSLCSVLNVSFGQC